MNSSWVMLLAEPSETSSMVHCTPSQWERNGAPLPEVFPAANRLARLKSLALRAVTGPGRLPTAVQVWLVIEYMATCAALSAMVSAPAARRVSPLSYSRKNKKY